VQSVTGDEELELGYAASEDVADVVVLVENAYRGYASRAGWSTEADLLGKRSR